MSDPSRHSSPAGPVRRPSLNRALIVAEAITLIREEGADAVTMRRLAQRLRTSPMSLYRHVADREDLMVGMLDDVAGRIRLPPPSTDPRSDLVGVSTAIHNALRDDPWVVPLLVLDGLAGPKILPALERLFAALEQAGFAPRDAMVAYGLIWHYTAGEALETHARGPDAYNRSMVRTSNPGQYPALARLTAGLREGTTGDDHFPENLQRILDGLVGRPGHR